MRYKDLNEHGPQFVHDVLKPFFLSTMPGQVRRELTEDHWEFIFLMWGIKEDYWRQRMRERFNSKSFSRDARAYRASDPEPMLELTPEEQYGFHLLNERRLEKKRWNELARKNEDRLKEHTEQQAKGQPLQLKRGGGQGSSMPKEKQSHVTAAVAEAKREATRLRIAELRKNKKGHTIHVTEAQNKKLKAIAAAHEKNVQAYLEDLIAENITANEHLVPVGRRKLAQGGAPKRVRSKRLTEANAHLRPELAKLKPS